MSEIWDRKMATLEAEERAATDAFYESIKWDVKYHEDALAEMAARRERLLAMKDDPEVYVRSTNVGSADVFHVSRSCGFFPEMPRVMLLKEATAKGLRRCSSWSCMTGTTITIVRPETASAA